MAKKQAQQIAQKSLDELKQEAKTLREDIMKLQLEQSQYKLKDTASLSTTKDRLARVLTQMHIAGREEKVTQKEVTK